MSIIKDKSFIINELKKHYNFKSDKSFADFLGISPQGLNTWKNRNTLDIELLYSKCVGVNANWLLTGNGEMFLDKENKGITTNTSQDSKLLLDKIEDLVTEKALLKRELEEVKKQLEEVVKSKQPINATTVKW